MAGILNIRGIWILLDEGDLARVKAQKWSVSYLPTGQIVFLTREKCDGKFVRMTLQRFLMQPKSDEVVFRNVGVYRFDYRKQSWAVGSMQQRQTRLAKSTARQTSKYKGVSMSKRSGLWRASIRPHGLSIYLGEYATEEEAAHSYDEAARKYYGDHAYQNFPLEKWTAA